MTITIDPAKDVEVEAFQKKAPSTGISNIQAAYVLACQLEERGCEVLSVRANKTPPAWMADIPPASVEISEADFRRHFSGFEAEKTSSSLRRQVNGVRVWCSLPTPPFVPPKPERVTL